MKNESVRQIRLAQEMARKALWRFLWTVYSYNPPNATRHFKEEFRKLWPPQYEQRGKYTRYGTDEDRRLNVAFLQILEKTSRAEALSEDDLGVLKDGLNRHIEALAYTPGVTSGFHRRHGTDAPELVLENYGPYAPSAKDAIRSAAEALVEYLNWIHRCGGPVHTTCIIKTCGSLMTTGRGGKKFCSPECRAAHWSYSRQKEYFLKAQRTNRRNRRKAAKASIRKSPKVEKAAPKIGKRRT